jgi:hypothetical protein
MQFLLLIHHGSTPVPGSDAWKNLSDDERNAVFADYQAINQTPGVTVGLQIEPPAKAVTVRRDNGATRATDGPLTEDPLAGYLVFEADDLDAAIELAGRIPSARMGGAVEVRPIVAR